MTFTTSKHVFSPKTKAYCKALRWFNKKKVVAFKVVEEDTMREFEETTKVLHLDIYNKEQQGVVNGLRDTMRNTKKGNTKEVAIRGRMKWKHVGDKCSRQFFQVIKKKILIMRTRAKE